MNRRRLASGRWVAVAIAAVGLLACHAATQHSTIPTLPGDTSVPAQPAAKKAAAAGQPDPWAGRTDLVELPAARPPAPVPLPQMHAFTLRNGLKVLVVEDHRLPVVSMQLAVKVGRQDARRDEVGIASFAAAMLTKGTRSRNASAIADAIDLVGGSLQANAGYEASSVECDVLSKYLDTCLTLVPDVVIHPTFPASAMKQVRADLRSQVQARRRSAAQMATAHFQNALWGDHHPRGWVMSDRTIGDIQRKDLVAWHARWYRPNNAVLAVVGDVNAKALRRRLRRAFRRWHKRAVPKRRRPAAPTLRGIHVRLVDEPGRPAAQIRIGELGIAHHSRMFYDAMVFNYALGGAAFGSRLERAVRSEDGEAFSARSAFDHNRDRGAFLVSAFAPTAKAVPTVELALREIKKMAASGPTQREVRAAVSHITGSYASHLQSASDIAGAVLAADLHGFGEGYVRDFPRRVAEVTPKSAAVAARKILDPKNLVVVIVGDAAKIQPQLAKAGWKYDEVSYTQPVAAYERALARKRAEAPVSPKAAAAGKRLLARAAAAKGGAARLARIKSIVLAGKATLAMGGRSVDATVKRIFVAPDKMRFEIDIHGGMAHIVTVYAGGGGWTQQKAGGNNKVVVLPPAEAGALRAQVWRDAELVLVHYRDKGTVVARLPDATVDGKAYDVVRVADPRGAVTKLFLDKKTHLLARMEYKEQGQRTVETYAKYERVKGIEVARSRVTHSPQGNLDVTIESVKVNTAVDPAAFAKPRKH